MALTILVTGATAGFGAAMARRFVADGHRVIAAARRKDRLQALQAEFSAAILPVALDVTDAAAVAALPGSLPPDWQQVDVLINNAGLARGLDPAHKATMADWDQMVAVNVSGTIHDSCAAARHGGTQPRPCHQHQQHRGDLSLSRRPCVRRVKGLCYPV
jgi:3-hydroxy acid dehydrogenase/malonic semialdehyde reductase